MREIIDFRIPEEHAAKWLKAADGIHLGIARKLELETSDPRMAIVAKADTEFKRRKEAFFTSAIYHRSYSKTELQSALFCRLVITSIFEPAGEENGTKYDESTACPKCGAQARQITPLYLPEKRIPKSKDISQTIAGEIVVSRKFAELFTRHQFHGIVLRPICYSQKSSAESQDWFQLSVTNFQAEIVPPTRVGVDPFDEDMKGEYRCPNGDTIGLNLLSELSIKAVAESRIDVVGTGQFLGCRAGLLRPEREILISQNLWRLMESEKISGYKVEVVHVVKNTVL